MNRKYLGTVEEDNIDELPDDFFKNARPFKEVFPELYESWKRRGRPRKAAPKKEIKLRIDPDVLAAFRATGKGWQSRMHALLKGWADAHPAATTS